MSKVDNSEVVRSQIEKLKIDVSAPNPTHRAYSAALAQSNILASEPRSRRTTLLLRDMPPQATVEDILALFPKDEAEKSGIGENGDKNDDKNDENGGKNDENGGKNDENEGKNAEKDEKGEKSSKNDGKLTKSSILNVKKAFLDNWELRFGSEELCVAAALFLQNAQLHGQPVHARVECSGTPPAAHGAVWSGGPMRYTKAARSPVVSSYSPILGFNPDRVLGNLRVPDGVFGEMPRSVPVSPMTPILDYDYKANPNFSPPNFYDFSNNELCKDEKIINQYKKMLKMKQKSLDRSSSIIFPTNMVKSIPKDAVAKKLKALSTQQLAMPGNLKKEDGSPRYYAAPEPRYEVQYALRKMPLSNPNTKCNKREQLETAGLVL